jgi:hypothetical protein
MTKSPLRMLITIKATVNGRLETSSATPSETMPIAKNTLADPETLNGPNPKPNANPPLNNMAEVRYWVITESSQIGQNSEF